MNNRDLLLRASVIFNSKHRNYKTTLEENTIVLNYYDKRLNSNVHVYLRTDVLDTLDNILNILEDLRKDLTGAKK